MSVTVEPGDPEDAAGLLRASHALMTELFDPDQNHFLDIGQLKAPEIRFFIARRDGAAVGCVALAVREGYGELKSMFVDPTARGEGVGRLLLERVEAEARALGLPMLRLETGNLLYAAHRLYRRAGFVERGPFGAYPLQEQSVFMEKPLAPPPVRVGPDYPRWEAVRRLILDAFAFMDGRIDPPSSAHRLSVADLADAAARGIVFVVEEDGGPVGCVICAGKGDALYLGKLAVRADRREHGLARALVGAAEDEARRRGLGWLELQTRIELNENHAAFGRMGFVKTGETAHEGYDRATSITMRRAVSGRAEGLSQ